MTDQQLVGFSLGTALTAVATAGQIANLVQNAIGNSSSQERDLMGGLPPAADFGAVSLLQRENGVYAVNIDPHKPVMCQISNPDGSASLGPWKIAPGDEIFLGAHIFGKSIPGTTQVTFSNAESGSGQFDATRQTTVVAGRVNRIRIGRVQAVGAFTFRITSRQLIIAASFAMAYFVLSRLQFTIDNGAGQRFSFSGLQGNSTGSSLDAEGKREWAFDLPNPLSDFSVDEHTPVSLEFDAQYRTGEAGFGDAVDVEISRVEEQEIAALRAVRELRRQRLENAAA